MRRAATLAALAALLTAGAGARPAALAAQDTARVERDSLRAVQDSIAALRDSLRTAARCEGQTITRIDIRPNPPDFGRILERSRLLARTVRSLHATTDVNVIRRFLILTEGQPCTELRRAESERILRTQPFIADARISVFPDVGGVRLDVYVVDETSIVGGVALEGAARPTRLRLGNTNLSGRAIYGDAEWRDGFFYRDYYGARFRHHQLFGRPYLLEARGIRRPVGGEWRTEMAHPFLTDLQRIAWRVILGATEEYVGFVREDGVFPSVRSRRDFVDVGGVVRIGVPGQLSLFGLSLSREREGAGVAPVVRTDTGIVAFTDAGDSLLRAYRPHESARVNALWGVRNIRFKQVVGFDALTAAQDVRTGVQFGTLFGRSLSVLGSNDDDILVAADLYAGFGGQRAFVSLQAAGSGREDGNTNRWDGVLASGRGSFIVKPTASHTFVATAEFGAGWRSRLPFQLTMGDLVGGVRGYRRSQLGGAQRAVLRLEERWFAGRPRGLGDLGFALFGDAGKLWAGDVPYGVDTPVNFGLGFGILAAVPPRSQRLYRLDVAFPVSADRFARWELRLSNTGARPGSVNEPGDLARSRERTLPTSIFTWP